jgi:hypothetical protein
MFSFLILVAIVAWTLSTGLKRYERDRRFSSWRVWLASALALSGCYLITHLDSVGISISWLDPILEDHLGLLTLALCLVPVFFALQFTVNRAILRDWSGARLDVRVNSRLCLRSFLSLLSIPLAIGTVHLAALFFIFVV